MVQTGIKELTIAALCVAAGAATLFGQLLVKAPDQRQQPEPIRAFAPPFQIAEPREPTASKTDAALCTAPETCPTSAPQPLPINLHRIARALIEIESAGDPDRVGRHGERGLMQIKPATWEAVTTRLYGRPLDFNRAFEKELNIKIGTAYLEELRGFLAPHRENWQADERLLLLACYNAGPTRVQTAGFDLNALPFNTQDYVARASALTDAL